MKRLIILFWTIIIPYIKVCGQSPSQKLKIVDFPNNGCIVFKDKNFVSLTPNEDAKYVILSNIDIIRAEIIADSLYQSFLQRIYDRYSVNGDLTISQIDSWEKTIKKANYFKEFKNFARQYAGFIDSNNDRLVAIYLLDFSKKKYRTNYFSDWHENLTIGFGEFYEKHTRLFIVNIDKNMILHW